MNSLEGVGKLIDLTINEEQLRRTVERAREKGIVIPTFEQMKDPDKIPENKGKAERRGPLGC